jgi:hypothetical protein
LIESSQYAAPQVGGGVDESVAAIKIVASEPMRRGRIEPQN